MPTLVVALALVLGLCGMNCQTQAETVESCQQCRDYSRACLRNHSPPACKTEYEICMKHCREK